jgi:alpha-tubulin suppressor-like RCC1 family protein
LVATSGAALPTLAASTSTTVVHQLYAFGDNESGGLGFATNDTTSEPNPEPTLVTLPDATGPVTAMATGERFTMVVTASGQLYTFGENGSGQLGRTANIEPNPTPTLVALPGATGGVTQVAAGAGHSLAVTSTGQLYAFGYNRYGQLGSATNNNTSNPNPTPTPVSLTGATGGVVQVAAGQYDSLAVTSTGQLYAFGVNTLGQLGNATNNKNFEPNPTPTLVTLPGATGPVVQAAAGSVHSLALTSTGQLYAFGYNSSGQLGTTPSTEPGPAPTPVTLLGATGQIISVAAGLNHSLALTSTGELYAFGENQYGQLGNTENEKTTNPNATPALVTLPGASGRIVRIAASVYDSFALTSTGELYAFGENYFGQLGNAAHNKSSEPNPTPTRVRLPGGASAVAMSDGPWGAQTLVAAELVVASPPTTTTTTGVLSAPAPRPPTIAAVHQSNAIWREGNKLAQISASRSKRRRPIGTTFSFSLNEQASVLFSFTHKVTGREVGRRCVAKTHKNSGHRRCKRVATEGALSFTGHRGTNNVVFQGRLTSSNKLRPGRHTLIIEAASAAGRSAPARLTFTIVR